MRLPNFLRSFNSSEASSDVISDGTASSPAAKTGFHVDGEFVKFYPTPSFAERYEAYDTIGRIMSAVESVVKAVNKRDFYFANVDEDNKSDAKIKKMEEWEKDNNGSKFVEEAVRTYLKAGTIIIGPDWKLVPMKSVRYMKRTLYGKVVSIVLDVGGKEWPLGAVDERGSLVQKIPIEDYMIDHYINDDREPWGKNLYYAICTTPPDIKDAIPIYKGFRQMEQDGIRMHHKIAAPKTLWIFPRLKNAKELDITNPKSLAYRIHNMGSGDSIVMGPDGEGAEIKPDQIDGKTRFPEVTDLIKGEVEVSAQSSTSRMIERPSAMADARVGAEQDDDTSLYVCELVRRLFDYVIIPKVVGDMSVEFRWGQADQFKMTFQDIKTMSEMKVEGKNVVGVQEVRDLLKKNGTPLDDTKYDDSEDSSEVPPDEEEK